MEGLADAIVFKEGDAHELPFDDGAFDTVFASTVIEEDGSCHPVPGHIWGGEQWNEALWYDRITFPDSRYLSAYLSGRPIIPRDALEEAFNTDETVKAETYRRDVGIYNLFKATSAANPQEKCRSIIC